MDGSGEKNATFQENMPRTAWPAGPQALSGPNPALMDPMTELAVQFGAGLNLAEPGEVHNLLSPRAPPPPPPEKPGLLNTVRAYVENLADPKIHLTQLTERLAAMTEQSTAIVLGKILLVLFEINKGEFHYVPGGREIVIRQMVPRDDYLVRFFYGPLENRVWSIAAQIFLPVDICMFENFQSFSVRLLSDIGTLHRLEESMCQTYNHPRRFPRRLPIGVWRVGSAVALNERGNWERGIVIETSRLVLRVWLLDSAREKIVAAEEVLPLLPEHHYYPPLGLRCCLGGDPNYGMLADIRPPVSVYMTVLGGAGNNPVGSSKAEVWLNFAKLLN